MKPFDHKNWNENAYHLYYRREPLFKELSIVTILEVNGNTVKYIFETDQFHYRDERFKVNILTFYADSNFGAEWSRDTEEFFELEVAELAHFI